MSFLQRLSGMLIFSFTFPLITFAQQPNDGLPAEKRMIVGNLLGTDDPGAGILSGVHMSTYNPHGSLGAAYGQLIESFKGGSASDDDAPVVGAMRGYNQIGQQVTNWVGAGGLFTTDNLSKAAQGVGISAQGNSWRGGRVWGSTLEGIERPDTFCTSGATAAACINIPNETRRLVVANGFIKSTETVLVNNRELVLGRDYTEKDCSGSAIQTCTTIFLTSGVDAGEIAYVYRGDPLQAIIGVEVDATGGPGPDTQNPFTGNRIGVGIIGAQTKTGVFSGKTHIGSMLALSTNANVIADRALSFSGADGAYHGGNGLDFANATFTGNAIYIPGQLSEHQNIGIGDTSTDYSITIAGTKETMPNGVGVRFRDGSSPPIDMRAFASSEFGTGNIGTWSDRDFVLWRNAFAAVRLSASAMTPNADNAFALGSSSVRWSSIYSSRYYTGTGKAGVTCTGAPSMLFASVAGIITHC